MENVLKNNTVTFIKLHEYNEDLFNNEIQPKLCSVLDEGDDEFVSVADYKDTKEEVLFVYLEQRKVDAMLLIFEQYGILEYSKNISREILMGDYYDEYNEKLESLDSKKMLDEFILKHLDVNTVLDKINERGIESLTKNDKIILEKL